MKRYLFSIICIIMIIPVICLAEDTPSTGEQETNQVLHSHAEKLGYVLGMEVGLSLKRLRSEFNEDAFLMGFEDSLNGNRPLLPYPEAKAIKEAFSEKMKEAREQDKKVAAEKNRKKGEEFLAENAKKKGVKTTASGLQYTVLKPGSGNSPKETDKVKVHYRGTLINGREFDSSFKRNKPAVFSVKGVIPGWTEGLQLMKVGGKYRLFIPPDLAYGKNGAGSKIPPESTLIFDIELLGIEK